MARAPRVLRVFPDAARVEQALLDASAAAPFVDATGFWSFSQLVAVCSGRKPVSPLAARLGVAAAVRALPAGPFGTWSRDIAFARSAHELIAQLEAQRATPEQLRPSARGSFIADLWERFRSRDIVDQSALLPLAISNLSSAGLPEALRGFDEVTLLALHDLPPVRLAFIDALEQACRAAKISVSLHLPRADNPAIDAFVNEASADFERRHETSQLELVGSLSEAPFAGLGRVLFSEQPAAAFNGLRAFSAASPRAEAREIARRARVLVDEGAAPETLAVVFRSLDADAEILVEALSAYGLDARARIRRPLGETPAGRLALDLPMLAEDAFPADRVARYLESRYLSKLWNADSHPGGVFAQAGLRDDRLGADAKRGAYAVRLEGLATRMAEGWPRGPSEQVRDVAARVERLIVAAASIRPDDTLAAHLEHWSRALEAMGFETPQDAAVGDAVRLLARTLGDASTAAGLSRERLTRREFSRWLHDAADELDVLIRTPRAGAVAILDARELAGRTFTHVFIAGLVDGRFPGRSVSSGLLSDDEKGALNLAARAPLFRLNVGERDSRLPLRVAEDRLLFHLSLCAASVGVTLSHARTDEVGREAAPSPFLREVERAVEGFELERVARGAVPGADSVSNEAELRLRAMLDGGVSASEGRWALQALALAQMETERLRFFSTDGAAAGAYSGLAPAGAFAADAQNPLAATQLDRWGNCAFQGFLGDVLGLDPSEEQGEDLDPRSRGSLMHAALEQLLPELKQPTEKIESRVREVVEAISAEHERTAAVGHPLLWKLSKDRAVTELVALLRSADARPFGDLVPHRAEVPFGREKADEAWRSISIPPALPGEQPIFLKGKLDRLDLADGQAGIVDYKGGKIVGTADRRRRLLTREWQLPVYAWAARSAGVATDVDAAWVSTRDGQQTLSKVVAEAGGTIAELLATDAATREHLAKDDKPNLATSLHRLAGKMREGDFAPRPEDCEFCRFRAVCRISGRKLIEEGFPK